MLEIQERYRDLPISKADNVPSGKTNLEERYYKIGDYEAMPSVTTVLNMIFKPPIVDYKMNRVLDYLQDKYKKKHWISTAPWIRYPNSKRAQTLSTRVKTSWADALASLRRNAKLHPDRVRDKAGGIGTEIHDAISAELQGELWTSERQEVHTAIQSYRMWRENSTVEPIWTEQTVWSLEYGYAGSADLVGLDNGRLIVLDWKTGRGVYNEAGLQVAAYSHAIKELTGESVSEGRVIHLDKTETAWSEHVVKDLNRSFNGFLSALNIWKLWHAEVFRSTDNDAFTSNDS